MKWQPIETAPKDGTRFLAAWEWKYPFPKSQKWCYVVSFYIDGEFVADWDHQEVTVNPTHWKPIKQPKTKKKEQ